MRLRNARSVTHHASGSYERAPLVDRRYPVAERQRGELFNMAGEESIATDREPARSQFM